MVAYRRKHEISLPEFSFRRPRLSGYLAVGFARLAAQGLLLAVFDAPGASWRLLALPGVLSRTLNRKTSTRNLRPYTLNLLLLRLELTVSAALRAAFWVIQGIP